MAANMYYYNVNARNSSKVVHPFTPTSYNSSSSSKWWSQVHKSRASVMPAAYSPFPSNNNKINNTTHNNNYGHHFNVVDIARERNSGHGSKLVRTGNTHRVISFHSSACWRDYFRASKQSDKLLVIYFTASWCNPCRYMAPILEEFVAEYTDVEFDKIDVDQLLDVPSEFRVQAMPTFLFIRRGKEIDWVTGAKREELQRKVEKYNASSY